MKRSICMLLLVFIVSQAWSQRYGQRDQTLANASHRSGFFLAPIVEYSNLQEDWNTAVGGGLAFVAGDFFIGGYGLGMVDFDQTIGNGDFETLDMGHGGFWFGFVTPQHYALHLFTSVKAGWGAVDIQFDNFDYEDAFFAVTPEAGLEINVFSWFRVATTVGYRFMNGLEDSPNFDRDDFEGLTGSLTFRIGGFGRRHYHDRWD